MGRRAACGVERLKVRNCGWAVVPVHGRGRESVKRCEYLRCSWASGMRPSKYPHIVWRGSQRGAQHVQQRATLDAETVHDERRQADLAGPDARELHRYVERVASVLVGWVAKAFSSQGRRKGFFARFLICKSFSTVQTVRKQVEHVLLRCARS